MTPSKLRRARACLASLLCLPAARVFILLLALLPAPIPAPLAPAIAVLVIVTMVVGEIYFARIYVLEKGRSQFWSLAAIFTLAGWIILWLLREGTAQSTIGTVADGTPPTGQ